MNNGGFGIGSAASDKAVPVTIQVIKLLAIVIFDRRLNTEFLPISFNLVMS